MSHDTGCGSPPVVCLSCAGGAHEEWSAVTARVSTRLLTYGRPSLGGSDPLPADLAGSVQTIGWAAGQLRTLLLNAAITAPYVLLTSSIGSWIADQFAALWPDEVAGMVLVDPTMASPWPELDWDDPIVDGADDEQGCLRFDWNDGFAELGRSVPPYRPRRVVISASDGHRKRNSPRTAWWEPLTLTEVEQLSRGSQRQWVDRLSAVHVVANAAGHFVHRDQPDLVAYVAEAVVDAARTGDPLRLTSSEIAAAGGRVEPASS